MIEGVENEENNVNKETREMEEREVVLKDQYLQILGRMETLIPMMANDITDYSDRAGGRIAKRPTERSRT